MENQGEGLGKAATGPARNPLGIIALFIVLVYGFACLVTTFTGAFSVTERLPLVYFLVIFSTLVLGVFAWLVSCHSNKLFAPSDFKSEESYLRVQLSAVALLAVASAIYLLWALLRTLLNENCRICALPNIAMRARK